MNTYSEGRRVLAIGLDAADYTLIKRWCAEGKLPQLDAAMKDGATGELKGADGYTAETPWTVFFTGCWPSTTGYWSPAKYHTDYRIDEVQAYTYDGFGPLHKYCGEKTVIALDLPQVPPSEQTKGLQIIAWGAHSPQTPSQSLPKSLFSEFVAKYGEHPAFLNDDYLLGETEERCAELEKAMLDGIDTRTRAALDFMAQKPWDLFMVVYGEPHTAGHGFWHLSQPEHPLYKAYQPRSHDPMLSVYQAVDHAVGRLRRAAPPDTAIVIFSPEGMKANSADVPSWVFLPELLYRMSFPGEVALAKGQAGTPLPPVTRLPVQDWLRTLWAESETNNPLIKLTRKHGRLRGSQILEHLLTPPAHGLRHPLDSPVYAYMPPLWYQNQWPKMKAFALPTFSEGNVRINVKGREAEGIVEPADFDRVCKEVIAEVGTLTNPRTGKPVLRKVLRERADPFDNPNGPDADIVLMWDPEPTDVMDSPKFGRFGPVPYRRSGDHYATGFFMAVGAGIEGKELQPGNLVDLAPTILDLLGVTRPNHFDGQSRVSEFAMAVQKA